MISHNLQTLAMPEEKSSPGATLHRLSVAPHASGLAARADGALVALIAGRRAVLFDPFEHHIRPRHELSLLRPAASVTWVALGSEEVQGADHHSLFVGTDNGRVEAWLRRDQLSHKYHNPLVLEHPTATGAAGLAAVPGRWPASGRVRAIAASPHTPAHLATAENRRVHLWNIDDHVLSESSAKADASSTISREPIFAMAWAVNDPNALAVADAGSFIHLLDTRTVGTKDGPDAAVIAGAKTTDSHTSSAFRSVHWVTDHLLASASDDGVVKVWDKRRGESHVAVLLRAHIGPALSLAGSTGDAGHVGMLASGGADGRVRLWNWNAPKSTMDDEAAPGISFSVNKLWNVDCLARRSNTPISMASMDMDTVDAPILPSGSAFPDRGGKELLPDIAFKNSTSRQSLPESIAGIALFSGLLVAVSADGVLARATVL